MPSISFTLCDVFSLGPLTGNQLAVLEGADGLADDELQALAREFNLSEVTILGPPDEGERGRRVRIFTTAAELPFAGHPILGTAGVLALREASSHVVLHCGVGALGVGVVALSDRSAEVTMSQPVPVALPFSLEQELLEALGVGESVCPIRHFDNGVGHVFVGLADEASVAAVAPDFQRLAVLAKEVGYLGVNCFAGSGTQWKTRMFAPGDNVQEDPATGSAAGPLAVHLATLGLIAFDEEITICQGAEIGRPSELRARVVGTTLEVSEVWVAGRVDIVGAGTLNW